MAGRGRDRVELINRTQCKREHLKQRNSLALGPAAWPEGSEGTLGTALWGTK